MSEALDLTPKIVFKGFKRIGVNIWQWVWLYVKYHILANIILISILVLNIIFASLCYSDKWAKSDYNCTYFPYNTFLSSIWFFSFSVSKPSTSEDIRIKLCTSSVFTLCHLTPKNGRNQSTTFQAPKNRICGSQCLRMTFYRKYRWICKTYY